MKLILGNRIVELTESYVFGTGSFALEISKLLSQHGVLVKGFLCSDSRFIRTDHEYPSTLISEFLDINTPIVIGIFNHYDDVISIARDLEVKGVQEIYFPGQIIVNLRTPFSKYYLTCSKEDLPSCTEIEIVNSLLQDEISRSILKRFVMYQLGDSDGLIQNSEVPQRQYLGESLPTSAKDGYFSGLNRVVDVGAYDGDTVRNFCDRLKVYDSAMEFICIEPDQKNFEKLKYGTANLSAKVLKLNAAVGDENGWIPFTHTGSLSSSALNDKNDLINIPQFKLDDLLIDWSPTLIKMDIEGAELSALKGSINILKSGATNFAISVYHQPKDIVSIPLYIYSLNKSYRFFLRTYGQHNYDTILYCVKS